MRPGRAVRLALAAGALTLGLSGPLGVASAVLVLSAVVAPPLRPLFWTPFHLVAIAASGLAGWYLGVIPAFAALLGWLAAHRLLVAQSRTDGQVLLLLATLMVLVGSVGAVSFALAPALLLFAAAAPIGLLHTFGVHDRALSAGVGVGSLAMAAGFFLLVPRVQGGVISGLGEGADTPRFADGISLGDEFGDSDDTRLLMRVRRFDRAGRELVGPTYLRGQALDVFDGRAWRASDAGARAPSGAWEVRSEVMLEPLEGSAVFGPPDVLYAQSAHGPILLGANGELVHSQPGRRISYEVFSRSRALESVESFWPSLTQLPELDPRVQALADELRGSSTDPAVIAARTLDHLARGFRYEESPPTPEGDPLTWFLFESRSGHCEYYASSLAVLLRAQGVPARLATGFYSAEYNSDSGFLAVRSGHAHAWVEVPVAGGWTLLDATPVGELSSPEVAWWQERLETFNDAWLGLVLDYDMEAQFEAAARVGSLVVAPRPGDPLRQRGEQGDTGVLLILAGVFGSGTVVRILLWWLARPRTHTATPDEGLAAFARARRLVVKRGWPIPPSLPPGEAGAWLAERVEEGESLRELAELVYRQRYGGESVDTARLRAAERAVRRVPKALPG